MIMFLPLFRRMGNVLIIIFFCVFTFSLFRPINYQALPRFNTSRLTSYLNGTNPFAHEPPSSCIPISTTTAFKTTRTQRFTTTSISSAVTTKTISFTSTQSVTVTHSTVVKETQACTCPSFPEYPISNAADPITPGVSSASNPKHVPLVPQTPEQETVAKLRAEGIVVIFKTGAQEVGQLAIQVGTTLRYLSEQDILFFSDQQGSIGPFLINDALRNVDQNLKLEDNDFEIYRDIRKYQSTGQDIQELKEDKSKGDGRSGWVLDKYKFIHMVEETFEMRPNARWYVFIETDSYVFWDNLVSFLQTLDSRKPMYIGSQVVLGGTSFAHGGSGYVLSNAAMNILLGPDQPQGLAASWDSKMKGVCCGDLALGIALKEKGVHLTVAHPLLNGYKPTTFTYGPNNHWCQPVVTMHHIMPHEISAVWRYERRREMLGITNATIFADLYTQFVEPHLTPSRPNWDNLSHGREYSQKIQDEASLYRQKVAEEKEAEKKAAEKKKADEEAKAKKLEEEKKKLEEEKKQKEEKEKEKQRQEVEAKQKKIDDEKEPDAAPPAAGNPATPSKGSGATAAAAAAAAGPGTAKANGTKAPTPTTPEKSGSPAPKAADKAADVPKPKEKDGKLDEISLAIAAQKEKLALEEGKPHTRREVDMKRKMSLDPEEMTPRDQDPQGEKASEPSKEAPKLQSRGDKKPAEPVDRTTKYTESEKHAHESFDACGKVCEEDEKCFQWVYYEKTCKLGMSFRLGKYMPPKDGGEVVWKSGWKVERIRSWTDSNACAGPVWPKLG